MIGYAKAGSRGYFDDAGFPTGAGWDELLFPGGLRTTTAQTGQQWDDPNGWAPLQWVAVAGLRRPTRRRRLRR